MRISELKRALAGNGAVVAAQPQPLMLADRSRVSVYDSPQAGLAFVQSNLTYVEREINQIMYPDIQYPSLIPVDTTAPEWIPTVTYYSDDRTGAAAWISGYGQDIPNADIRREKFKAPIYMAAIGYGYSLEEIGQAQLLGMNLPSDKAASARRAYEEFVDNIALNGDSTVNFEGLINNSLITPANVAQNAGGTSRLWANKTADEILADLNEPLIDTHSTSLTVEMANTILLSPERYNFLASTPRSSTSDTTLLEYFRKYNPYTAQTNQPIDIRMVRGLSTAGATNTQRMISYRKSPEVLKLHIPMVHRFLPVFQKTPMYVEVPGIFRLGGLEIRRPGAMRYRDGF